MTHFLKSISSKRRAAGRFAGDGRGNVAVITALCAVPLFAAGGIAIDVSNASFVRTYLQAEADAAALAAAALGPSADDSKWATAAEGHAKARFGAGIEGLTIQGKWLSATDFSVEASAAVPVSLLAAVPGFAKKMNVSVAAVARYKEPVLEYKPPTLAQLDHDAADYNRIYVYCYNPAAKKDADKRTQMTAVADNADTKYTYTMPECAAKEALSFRLHNVRNARTQNSKWDSSKAEHYEHYTDTVISGGKETYALTYSLLETVLCDTEAQCKPKSQGGVVPEGTNRTPVKATGACATGKYMYYGWEDRPPEQGGSDKDYNDIRIVIGCPTVKASGAEKVALIK
ncbi:MAG: TadE/TadG family type IV pilus assembly protein [Parvibaculaceae bacterium]